MKTRSPVCYEIVRYLDGHEDLVPVPMTSFKCEGGPLDSERVYVPWDDLGHYYEVYFEDGVHQYQLVETYAMGTTVISRVLLYTPDVPPGLPWAM